MPNPYQPKNNVHSEKITWNNTQTDEETKMVYPYLNMQFALIKLE